MTKQTETRGGDSVRARGFLQHGAAWRYREDDCEHVGILIAAAIRAPMVFVAEDEGRVVGVLRGGRQDRLQSLFVAGSHQRRGIGRQLVERFERESLARGLPIQPMKKVLKGKADE